MKLCLSDDRFEGPRSLKHQRSCSVDGFSKQIQGCQTFNFFKPKTSKNSVFIDIGPRSFVQRGLDLYSPSLAAKHPIRPFFGNRASYFENAPSRFLWSLQACVWSSSSRHERGQVFELHKRILNNLKKNSKY